MKNIGIDSHMWPDFAKLTILSYFSGISKNPNFKYYYYYEYHAGIRGDCNTQVLLLKLLQNWSKVGELIIYLVSEFHSYIASLNTEGIKENLYESIPVNNCL